MSIKMKLSLMFSIIVAVLFILYQVVNDLSLKESVHDEMVFFMEEYTRHTAHSIFKESDRLMNEETLSSVSALLSEFYFDIKEITLFDKTGRSIPLGSYLYNDATNDYTFMQATDNDGFTYRSLDIKDGHLFRSYLRLEELDPYIVSIVYDGSWINDILTQSQIDMLLYCISIAIFLLLLSYWAIGYMLSPLKQILWKVNEISSVRFHQLIRVNSNDEFGSLAKSINAMSQNLSIYMEKLRKAFEENRRMKEHLESFINNSSDAIFLMDLMGRVIQVNHAYLNLFEYELDEVLNQPITIIPEDMYKEAEERYEALLKGKQVPSYETVRKTKSGELIPVNVSTSAIRDKNGVIFAIASITRDMRSRNRMEELLRRSEKLTTVGLLAAGVAHEIRNPLTTLRGFLQLQQRTGKLELSHTELMLSELDRINLIVGEFLILAKPQAVKFVSKDVRAVMRDVTGLLDSEAHLHNIEFELKLSKSPCMIACEENQLKQVFINLLKNAIEAMPSGGSIHIDIRNSEDQVAVTITDEGIGISEEALKRLGDPFFTAKDTGTGLGIMVSQRIIQMHKGTLDIMSEVDVGTTAIVKLPALKDGAMSVIL